MEGLENLPPDGPFILAVNHLSMADVPLALTVMPRRTIVLANERLRRSPLLHLVVGQLGEAIYVPKGGDVTGSLQKALDILAGGSIVALSPEGTRSPSGLKRAQTGVAWLALRSGLPVVPYVAWDRNGGVTTCVASSAWRYQSAWARRSRRLRTRASCATTRTT